MASTLRVFEPTAAAHNQLRQPRQSLDSLAGKVIGFIDNSKPNFNYLVDDLAEVLVSRYGIASVIKHRKRTASISASDAVLREITEKCDAIVTGSGD